MSSIVGWLLQYLVPIAVNFISQFGLPALEQKFPALIPLITAILSVLKGKAPMPELHQASDHFNGLISKR